MAMNGTMLGSYSIKVVKSKTAIVPINSSLLPRTDEELERCKRTVYVANIDIGCDTAVVHAFFQGLCGDVVHVHLNTPAEGHESQAAFIEFAAADSADRALSCGGARIKMLPTRVSRSKTPVALL
jgi:RNA recognition motif. (a.k.a. RRM, RBD, or RNP domain)